MCRFRELKDIYHHHPESKKRKSSEGNSGSIHPYGRYGNAGKTSKSISTIAILWPVKATFEKRAATVEVDTSISPAIVRDKKSMAMAMFRRTFARTMPDNLRAPPMKMWGFEAKRAKKFTRTSPRTLPCFFHYHAFFFPEIGKV